MVNKVHIKNFKSVYDLELDLGRFNVFIGENGCGKSNILEAFAMGSAASANLLSTEFLASRGIRIAEIKLLFSAFSSFTQFCDISFVVENKEYNYHPRLNEKAGAIQEIYKNGSAVHLISTVIASLAEKDKRFFSNTSDYIKAKSLDDIKSLLQAANVSKDIVEATIEQLSQIFSTPILANYLIYSPENKSLRNFFEEKQISPLGLNGEGLFRELKRISIKKSKKQFKEINKYLSELLDWFEQFELPTNSFPGEQYLRIKDKYLAESVEFIDQRSANEGFLFLLFFLTLFISEETPSFFAIDNIENSFNPKLCSKLSQVLLKLAKEHDKQALITTHNPFILDGLDLEDDEQRLFVVRRNLDGHTIATRIKPDKPLSYRLSEAWMNGYIGGLPNNF